MNISKLNLITFNEDSREDLFYASYKHKKHNKATHWHDFYEIHLITHGTVTERINGNTMEMGPGWIYFLKPYDVHEYWCDEPITMYKIQFMIDILDADVQKALLSSHFQLITKLSERELQEFIPILNNIVEERNTFRPDRMKMISHLMNCLAIKITRLGMQNKEKTSSADSVVMALEYIHQNYTDNITLQQVAAHVGLTPNYFCSKFHKDIGQSFKHYLRGLQLNHAATLLRVSDSSISQVCQDSGFSSMAHFFKDFKAYYGLTPSQYRENQKQTMD